MTRISSERMALGLLFIALSVLACMVKAHSDTFWQLRAGEDIWRTGHVTFVDPYSYTARGLPWPDHEWLSEALFYAVHRVGGMLFLAAFCAGVIVAAYVLSWRLTAGSFEVRFVVFALSLTDAVGGWSMRPQIMSMLCFMLTCTLLAKDRLWWLPPLFLVWANLHGGVGLGLISLGAVVTADTIALRRIPWRLLAAALSSGLATAVTPMGIGLWKLLAAYAQREKTPGILEWMPPAFPPSDLAFWGVAALLVGGALWRFNRLDLSSRRLTAIAAATLILALSASRNITMFLLVAVPAVSALISFKRAATLPSPDRDRNLANSVIVGVTGLGAFAAVAMMWSRPPAFVNWHPIEAAAIEAVTACPRPMYNSLGLGGLLIWFVREQPVFIDNRNDPYPIDLLEANLPLEQTGAYQSLFDQYGFRCAVVEAGSFTDRALTNDPAWRVAYSDQRLSVHQRAEVPKSVR